MEIPKAYQSAEWSDFKDIDLSDLELYLRRIQTAVEDGDGLLIFGPPLSGKTRLSAYLAKLFRRYSYTVQWASALDIQDNIVEKNRWGIDSGELGSSYLERYRLVDVLVIDGFSTELSAVRQRNRVQEIIEYRLQWDKVTIINTHKNHGELDECYHSGYGSWLINNFFVLVLQKPFQRELQRKYRS